MGAATVLQCEGCGDAHTPRPTLPEPLDTHVSVPAAHVQCLHCVGTHRDRMAAFAGANRSGSLPNPPCREWCACQADRSHLETVCNALGRSAVTHSTDSGCRLQTSHTFPCVATCGVAL